MSNFAFRQESPGDSSFLSQITQLQQRHSFRAWPDTGNKIRCATQMRVGWTLTSEAHHRFDNTLSDQLTQKGIVKVCNDADVPRVAARDGPSSSSSVDDI